MPNLSETFPGKPWRWLPVPTLSQGPASYRGKFHICQISIILNTSLSTNLVRCYLQTRTLLNKWWTVHLQLVDGFYLYQPQINLNFPITPYNQYSPHELISLKIKMIISGVFPTNAFAFHRPAILPLGRWCPGFFLFAMLVVGDNADMGGWSLVIVVTVTV